MLDIKWEDFYKITRDRPPWPLLIQAVSLVAHKERALDLGYGADFSLHLRWPEDIDALCRAMIAEGLSVPGSCDDLLAEELWFDGYSAWVDRISQTLPLAIAHASAISVKRIAERWVKSYIPDPSADPVYYASAYNGAVRALSDLCMVSQDVLERGRALLLFRLW